MDSESIRKIIGRKQGVQIEVISADSQTESLKIENKEFKGSEISHSSNVMIRCIYRNKGSIVSGTLIDESDLDKMIDNAISLAKTAGSNDFQKYLYRKRYSIKERLVYRKPADENFVNRLIKDVNGIRKDPKLYSLNSIASESKVRFYGANSFGAAVEGYKEMATLETEAIAKDGINQGTGSEYSESHGLNGIDIQKNLSSALKIAKSMINAKAAPTCTGQLLLDPKAAISFVNFFTDSLDGEDIYKKKSFLSGMKNKQVASKIVDIKEEVYMRDSLYNRRFDDELMPTSSKSIVKGGKLKTYLHSIYSAEKMHEKPTGNNFMTSKGGISATNLVVKPGKLDFNDMISKVKRGIYMIDTGDRPNESTGDLSAMVSVGYYVENGEIKYPVKETLVGANMLGMMRNVIRVGSDKLSMMGTSSPSLLIDGIKISGK